MHNETYQAINQQDLDLFISGDSSEFNEVFTFDIGRRAYLIFEILSQNLTSHDEIIFEQALAGTYYLDGESDTNDRWSVPSICYTPVDKIDLISKTLEGCNLKASFKIFYDKNPHVFPYSDFLESFYEVNEYFTGLRKFYLDVLQDNLAVIVLKL